MCDREFVFACVFVMMMRSMMKMMKKVMTDKCEDGNGHIIYDNIGN